MKRVLFFCLIALTLLGCSEPIKYDIVIEKVNLFDGYEDLGIVNVAINKDTIAAITTNKLDADSTIDGSGKFIIPGLVNAHVHASKLDDLKEGYPLGILTLLNMHTGLEDRELDWKTMSRDSIGFSTLYGAGHAATVPGGHPNQFSPDMETISDSLPIADWLQHRMDKEVDYIKVIRENHEWMGYPPLPSLSFEQIKNLIDAAHNQNYKVVVHANTVAEMMQIAQFKPDGFVHMLDYKEDLPIPDSFYVQLAKHNIFVVPTAGMALKSMEDAPPFIQDWVSINLLNAQERADIIKEMHEQGILMVAGTDAQEGQMNFGEDYFLELELYKMAGLSNLEVLKTATGNAAKAFDLPIGEIKKGSKATFVLLNANPLSDLSNLKEVGQIWKNGMIN
ncbi:amidohydrolase family protein [Algoriphagus machipongonensis]|nr:amidohydrolase family protein [Algoriphagus machipongonensis]